MDYAIPAGRYYVYSTISDDAERNYKYNYLGGTLTIKTKTVGLTMTDYSKEYGDVYYTNANCLIKDGSLISGEDTLISDCLATGSEATLNTVNNTYGFTVNELVSKDVIADNFNGRPIRVSNLPASLVDLNGLQENVGIYKISDGTIVSKHNNTFNATCTDNFIGDEDNGCVVVGGDDYKINNYMVNNDAEYTLTYYLLKNGTVANSLDYSSNATLTIVNPGNKTVDEATLTITPATITIEVTPGQTKMYGCAYNGLNTTSEYTYTYADGYGSCVSTTGTNYDLGYAYTVKGDKDYYIYNYGYYTENYNYAETVYYTSDEINEVIKDASGVTLDDSLLVAAPARKGSRSTALNGGVLYRVENSIYNNAISYSSIVAAADAAQANTPSYQSQSVGTYVITLGNLNAALTSTYTASYTEENNKVCNASNMPGEGNSEVCRNYIINYYGSSSADATHTYDSEDKDDLTFTITTRVAFIYAKYNSKVYGNNEPIEKLTCDNDLIEAGVCSTEGQEIVLGVTEYYTKYNSLAKAPYVASIESGSNIVHAYDSNVTKNDKQTDVVTGESSRKGMNDGERTVDDIVGVYNYIFDDVTTTTYSQNNYVLNFYYRDTSSGAISIVDGVIDETTNEYILDATSYNQKMAVNENGTTEEVVDSIEKKVYFEINLRKITVKLIDFSKVYGIEDHRSYFDLAICATGDEVIGYDEKGNPTCSFAEGVTFTEHGLTPTHKGQYVADGTLKQEDFKDAFHVTFLRALGENTACPTQTVTGTLNGHFTAAATEYAYELSCSSYAGGVTAYQALGIINQSNSLLPGYNYEITYEEGDMIILPRTIKITPDSNQGFQYGSYTYPSLIPAITFTNSLMDANYGDENRKIVAYDADTNTLVRIVNRDGTNETTTISTSSLGLVNDVDRRICLTNINGTDKFCINDRQDTYDVNNTEKSTSSYAYNTTGSDTSFTTYVFGDNYQDETTTRSALDRVITGTESQRYNRNVGTYIITKGDLTDKSGNYTIVFDEATITYNVTYAELVITPVSGQSKVYGEADKELTFTVTTKYTVNSTQHVMYDDSIVSVVDKDGNTVVINRSATSIVVEDGSTVTLNGFAYYENMSGDYNYGVIKDSNKSGNSAALTQVDVEGMSFDKYCYDNYNGLAAGEVIANCTDRKIVYETTTMVLVGYLYVTDYVQKAGTYHIANGFVVADNEFDQKNYDLRFVDDVDFVINKLDVNVHLLDITKGYGIATDAYKCDVGITCSTSNLTAQDHENMLEYNFDISYKDGADIIAAGTYEGQSMVLMVNAINNNYYTQSETREDKNNYLGITVIRKSANNVQCSIDTDLYGCEDAGEYDLVVRKFEVILAEKDGSTRYDDNYNLMVDNVTVEFETIDNSTDAYVVVNPTSHEVEEQDSIEIIDELVKTLTITQRTVDVFVNTNVNMSESNYFEIEQNVEVPNLPYVDNDYNLTGYTYDPNGLYHGTGEDASSKSDDPNLGNTYGKIVWGGQPNQVRTSDALVGAVAYCNEARNGDSYSDTYPTVNTLCTGTGTLVYNDNKAAVNTATKDKFIFITRDTNDVRGLKIRPDAGGSAVSGNDYENKNYVVNFYPGAVHVVGDDKAPILVIGNEDYYIEANAFFDEVNSAIVGSYTGIDAILEFLANGEENNYILANVDENGNLYITLPTKNIVITQSSLQSTYGVSSEGYQGIVSGIEQELVYPFTSNYAHMIEAKADSKAGSYLNETNITMLEELITTFIKWFDVDSYDSGQYLNGQYLQRRFDRYYYIAINKNGYDIANDIDNEFAINKVGTYNVSFYVMDNAGRVSKDGNIARLHIIDTTKPEGGELNLYSAPVKCDSNCDAQDSWYINTDKVKLAAFNKYKAVDDGEGNITYVLDPEGEYIYYTEIGNDSAPYKLISDLTITTIAYVDYIETSSAKFMAYGVLHHTWASSPDGIYLTITGGRDNSYTVEDDTSQSQWKHYYSLDGDANDASYWTEYIVTRSMVGYTALISDGTRTIHSMTMDSGIKIEESGVTNYSFTYAVCYQDCKDIETVYKVSVGGNTYEFVESQVQGKKFDFNAITECVINKNGTLVTCSESGTTEYSKLEGNEFTYRGNNYIILGNNVLTNPGHEYVARLRDYEVTLDNGITYKYDRVAGLLYREHIGEFGVDTGAGIEFHLNGVTYLIVGTDIKFEGATIAVIDSLTNAFTLDDIEYNYIVDANKDYYYGVESYPITQNHFKINGITYTFAGPGSVNVSGQDIVTVKANKHYTNTYTLYDKYLKGIEDTFRDSASGEVTSLTISNEMIMFSEYITSNVGWNIADSDTTGTTNEELSGYLNYNVETKYFKDKKVAYLDNTAPLSGITIFDTSNNVVSYGDGEKIFTHEYGYYNTTRLSPTKTYNLRGKVFTVDMDERVVIDYNNEEYPIVTTSEVDTNKRYKYVINYVTYYIDEAVENIYWLPAYVESYVGGKDTPKGGNINTVEVPMYNALTSVLVGQIKTDTIGTYRLMNGRSTNTAISSGIGSTKYQTSGTANLYDFIYLGVYGKGIYYKDIDYIVSYVDPDDNTLKQVNLNSEFKACYDSYEDAEGNHMITQDCAQAIIADVIRPRGAIDKDITYDIYYIIRDKAGNASAVLAKGVIYATILPSTNVIIQNVAASLTNSEIVAVSLGNDEYQVTANQGVSLALLDEAFEINYVKNRTGQNYNNQATMMIYKNDELIADSVTGVNYLEYVDSSEIADYKIVYNLTTTHTPAFGDDITVNGRQVTLYLSITSPRVDETPDSSIRDILSYESNYVGIVMFIGFILLSALFVAFLILRKRR